MQSTSHPNGESPGLGATKSTEYSLASQRKTVSSISLFGTNTQHMFLVPACGLHTVIGADEVLRDVGGPHLTSEFCSRSVNLIQMTLRMATSGTLAQNFETQAHTAWLLHNQTWTT